MKCVKNIQNIRVCVCVCARARVQTELKWCSLLYLSFVHNKQFLFKWILPIDRVTETVRKSKTMEIVTAKSVML